ncbi:alpha-adducin-like isoform X3 [Bolinopsis microptera]|uniref:alpha-adducin-like isoform X3 n=1 Tax=Bolinopsis microptera TaxID=2820187 RepID=UPI003079FBEC
MPKGGAHNPSVDRDKRNMGRKKRVTEILEDQFRSELEDVVISQKEGNKPLFHGGVNLNGTGGPTGGSEFKGLANMRQVNDLNGSLRDKYSKPERELRCKLAALYRLTAHFEWDHLIYSHITARLPDNKNHFLINPYGMQYSEITASSLIKVDKDGKIIDAGSTVLPVNKAGFKLNSALHETGQDIVYHTHSHAGTAISAMKCGLLNLCQEAIIVRPVSYGTYQGFVPSRGEQAQIKKDLMDDSHVMILENHGLVSVGPTIEETFLWMAQLTKACEIQWRVLRCGKDNLTDRTFDENKAFEGDLPVELECNPNGVEYSTGELEFESYMRMLDNQGANTGYPYKMPNIFRDQIPTYPAVQYPPIVPGMEGPPSDTDRSKITNSKREAWFINTQVTEQRISTKQTTRKSDEESVGKGSGKRFAPFDSVVSPAGSRSGDKPKDDTRSLRIHEIEQELEKMQAQYSSKPKDRVSSPSGDSRRSDQADVISLSDSPSSGVELEGPPTLLCESVSETEEMPEVGFGFVNPVEDANNVWEKKLAKLDPKFPLLTRDVPIDLKMSVTTDPDVEEDAGGEDGAEIADEIVVNTVTTSIIEITEVQEDEFEVITLQPGQLTEDQKAELIKQGYVLQEV